jgi:hypothetical protein
LRAADLAAEQSYLVAARRRHNIGQHGWGIVQGLGIRDTPDLVVVQPGVAVDGYGRELIVTAPVTIPSDVFTKLADEALDVWLVYRLVEVNVSQGGRWSCGPGKNPKTHEQVTTVRLTPAPPPPGHLPKEVPRNPVEVSDADLPFLPHRLPPDDPAAEWPVYLGTIKKAAPHFDPNSPRPYATLTGQVVTATSGLARMQVDAESQNDNKPFAIAVADASGKLIERLGIDPEGNTLITGNTTVKNAVDKPDSINANHLSLGPARLLNFRPLAATPAAAAPWRIYRTSVTEDNATIRQLRFEFFHPGDKGEAACYRFAIGTRNDEGFSSCLKLSADCTLTITENLTIGGQLVEGLIQADPTDKRFGAMVAQVWAVGTRVGEVTATTGTITGVVTDTADKPMKDVNVKLVTTGFETTAPTDDVGRYIAHQIPIGDYTISAKAPGFETTNDTGKLTTTPKLEVSLKLRRIRRIQGTVRDTNGAAVPNAALEFTDTVIGTVATINANNAGFFEFEPLTVGPYSILVTAPGFVPQTVPAAPGDVLNITLQTIPPPRIRGTVRDTNGAAVPNAALEFTDTVIGTVATINASNSGLFEFQPLTVGPFSVRVTAPGFVPQTVAAAPGDVLNITLQTPPPPPRILGNVIDSNGAAILGVLVEFRNQTSGALSSVVTDESGNFNSGPLTPGTYEIRVTSPGFVTQIVTAALGDIVTITLQPFNPGPP